MLTDQKDIEYILRQATKWDGKIFVLSCRDMKGWRFLCSGGRVSGKLFIPSGGTSRGIKISDIENLVVVDINSYPHNHSVYRDSHEINRMMNQVSKIIGSNPEASIELMFTPQDEEGCWNGVIICGAIGAIREDGQMFPIYFDEHHNQFRGDPLPIGIIGELHDWARVNNTHFKLAPKQLTQLFSISNEE